MPHESLPSTRNLHLILPSLMPSESDSRSFGPLGATKEARPSSTAALNLRRLASAGSGTWNPDAVFCSICRSSLPVWVISSTPGCLFVALSTAAHKRVFKSDKSESSNSVALSAIALEACTKVAIASCWTDALSRCPSRASTHLSTILRVADASLKVHPRSAASPRTCTHGSSTCTVSASVRPATSVAARSAEIASNRVLLLAARPATLNLSATWQSTSASLQTARHFSRVWSTSPNSPTLFFNASRATSTLASRVD
mmetsp:Transcript_68887/g.158233  ORF Transcript_68887/g.158233 Transcript_68887/m.158233 type:complete len:257 (-) Transcript_68887:351-1121(-)